MFISTYYHWDPKDGKAFIQLFIPESWMNEHVEQNLKPEVSKGPFVMPSFPSPSPPVAVRSHLVIHFTVADLKTLRIT